MFQLALMVKSKTFQSVSKQYFYISFFHFKYLYVYRNMRTHTACVFISSTTKYKAFRPRLEMDHKLINYLKELLNKFVL